MSLRKACGVVFLSLTTILTGCAGRSSVLAGPGFERGGLPDLRGAGVLALPLQLNNGVHSDVAHEIEFALRSRTNGEGWTLPEELRGILRANPGTQIVIDALPVQVFLSREVQRVGDPLFGDLYRLGVLTNTTFALLPIEARTRVTEGTNEAVVEIVAALLESRSGRVLWFGVVGGSAGPPGTLSAAATAAEALARRVIR